MTRPKRAEISGLHVMPHVDPTAWLIYENATPPAAPSVPKMRYRTRPLMSDGIGHQGSARKALLIAPLLVVTACSAIDDAVTSVGEHPRPDADAPREDVAPTLPPWPALPRDDEEALALVETLTTRPPDADEAFDASDVAARVRALSPRALSVGREAVAKTLAARLDQAAAEGRDAWLLVGNHHDAGAQVRAFRWLVSHPDIGRLDAVAVEQLHASGRWGETPSSDQRGDEARLERWTHGGDRADLRWLMDGLWRRSYTAWKYGYLEELEDLLIAGRALTLPLCGCDVPASLEARLAALETDLHDRVREAHCALSLRDRLRGPARVAAFWGDEHLRSKGFPRYLPREARVIRVHLVGGRRSDLAPEAALARSLSVTEPVLVPLEREDAFALLIAGPRLAAAVDRTRDPPALTRASTPAKVSLRVESVEAAVLRLGDAAHRVQPDSLLELDIDRGVRQFVLESEDRLLIGRLPAPCRQVHLAVVPRAGRARVLCQDGGARSGPE